VAKRLEHLQSPGGVTLSLTGMAALLGLPAEGLEGALRGVAPLRRSAHDQWFRWDDIKHRLGDDVLAQLRARLWEQRSRGPVSKRWIAGYPHLLAQWDWSRNLSLLPDEVSFGSHRRVWWRCEAGPDHRWDAVAQSRVNGAGCPFCAGQRVSVTNSLLARRPDVAASWHPSRNLTLTPAEFVWSSNEEVWWKCPRADHHEWRARINNRTSNDTGCPFCCGAAPSQSTSLAAVFPELAEEWHPTLNGDLRADGVTTQSNRAVWWRCAAGHEWRASVENRARGSGCPRCARKRG